MLVVSALIVAALAALLHVYIWVMESITWRQPETWRRFGVKDQDAADAVQPMAFNQGFYNLFLAIATLLGIVVTATGAAAVGLTLVLTGTGSMLAAALVLLLSSPDKRRAAVTQGFLPLIALVLLLLV